MNDTTQSLYDNAIEQLLTKDSPLHRMNDRCTYCYGWGVAGLAVHRVDVGTHLPDGEMRLLSLHKHCADDFKRRLTTTVEAQR